MRNSKSENFWKNLVSEWSQSSLGQNEFCRTKDVSPKTFWYWKQRLSIESTDNSKCSENPTNVNFVEVCEEFTPAVKEVKAPAIKAPRFIIIRSANGCVIEVPL